MLVKTRGIVFHTIKYSDSGIIAKIYTEKFGLRSYLIKGIKNRKSKIKSGHLQPLSLLDLVVYEKNKPGIQYLKEIENIFQFSSIPFDIKKSSILLFINEILYKSIYEEVANSELFNFICDSIKYLDKINSAYQNFHLYFTINLTKYLGFFPRNNYSELNNCFDLQEGVFRNEKAIHEYFIEYPLSKKFSRILHSDFPLQNFQISSAERIGLLLKIIEYYQLHLPGFKDVKSHLILQQVLN